MAFSVVVEGMEYAGKTTLADNLVASFQEMEGVDVLQVREPGGTEIGEEIRLMLKGPLAPNLDPMTNLYLYTAGRNELFEKVIVPFRETHPKGITVSDRSWPSTFVHQSMDGVNYEDVYNSQRKFMDYPDLILFLDINSELAYQRALLSRNEGRAFDHRDAKTIVEFEVERRRYMEVLKPHLGRVEVVDGSVTPEEVLRETRMRVIRRIAERENDESSRDFWHTELQKDIGNFRNGNPERK